MWMLGSDLPRCVVPHLEGDNEASPPKVPGQSGRWYWWGPGPLVLVPAGTGLRTVARADAVDSPSTIPIAPSPRTNAPT
jgi:hypothetical protein